MFFELIFQLVQLFVNVNQVNLNNLVYTLQHVILNRYCHIFWCTCAPGNWKSFIQKNAMRWGLAKKNCTNIQNLHLLSPLHTLWVFSKTWRNSVNLDQAFCCPVSKKVMRPLFLSIDFLGNQKTKRMFFSDFSAPFIWFVFWKKKKKAL